MDNGQIMMIRDGEKEMFTCLYAYITHDSLPSSQTAMMHLELKWITKN